MKKFKGIFIHKINEFSNLVLSKWPCLMPEVEFTEWTIRDDTNVL